MHPLVMWCLLLNALTLIIYGIDKLAAVKSWQRVPEMTLLFFGLIGGWVGAILGQQIFRHKTQKQPYKTYFIITVILNLAVTLGAMYWVYQYGIGVQW
ncbi:integral membrane protein [Hafnia paralvei ATCC 29927]|nr:integral membrane protein [Hafnia paralvei ATCC 29927]